MSISKNLMSIAVAGAGFSALLAGPPPASATSFSCMEPDSLSAAAETVCDSPALGALDERLDSWYRRALIRAGYFEQTEMVRSEQREWIADRDDCGANRACIRRAYLLRIRQLKNYVEHV